MSQNNPGRFRALGGRDPLVPKTYLLRVIPIGGGEEMQIRLDAEQAAEQGRAMMDWANRTDPAAAYRGVGHVMAAR